MHTSSNLLLESVKRQYCIYEDNSIYSFRDEWTLKLIDGLLETRALDAIFNLTLTQTQNTNQPALLQ